VSVQPNNDDDGSQDPAGEPPDNWWSLLLKLIDQHFGRFYLVLVTVLAALVAFAFVTGSAGPLWAGAVVTGLAGGTAVKPLMRRLKGQLQE